jgi:hypothetical protein
MTLVISFGKWRGAYTWRRPSIKRLCLGWLTITFIPVDFDRFALAFRETKRKENRA